MSPIVVVVTLTPSEGNRDALLAVCEKYWPGIQGEPGCELLALHENTETFVVIERWASREIWEQHLSTEANAALNTELAPLLGAAVNVWDLTPVPIGDAAKALV